MHFNNSSDDCYPKKKFNMKHFRILFLVLIFLNPISKQIFSQEIIAPSDIKWYSIEEADSIFKVAPKPMFIDVYTEWCGWCKHMMKTTFANKGIASYINQNFIPVRFDAETFDTLTFMGKTYTNPGVGSKPKHDLAKYLLGGRFSFPTIVYIARNKQIYPIPGYQKTAELEPFLVYFAENLYGNISLQDFDRYFKCAYPKNYEKKTLDAIPPAKRTDTTGIVKWYSLAEAEQLSKTKHKLIYISFSTSWCHSCKVSDSVNFKSKVIADYLNEHYIPVKTDAASQETITFFGNTFKPNGKGQPHQIVQAYMKESYQMPTSLFVNTRGQRIAEIHGFIPPAVFEVLITYFATSAYTHQKFEDYKKTFENKIMF